MPITASFPPRSRDSRRCGPTCGQTFRWIRGNILTSTGIPGEHGEEPDVICYGADGQPGGDGVNADIASWKIRSGEAGWESRLRPLRRPARGVTLMEMMVVLVIITLIVGISFPSTIAGLENLRLTAGARSVAAFMNIAANRAERRQQAIELSISVKDNAVTMRSAEAGFLQETGSAAGHHGAGGLAGRCRSRTMSRGDS